MVNEPRLMSHGQWGSTGLGLRVDRPATWLTQEVFLNNARDPGETAHRPWSWTVRLPQVGLPRLQDKKEMTGKYTFSRCETKLPPSRLGPTRALERGAGDLDERRHDRSTPARRAVCAWPHLPRDSAHEVEPSFDLYRRADLTSKGAFDPRRALAQASDEHALVADAAGGADRVEVLKDRDGPLAG